MQTYMQDQDTKKRTRSQSWFTPLDDEDTPVINFGEDEEDSSQLQENNEAQEYNKVSSFSDVNQTESKRMYVQTLDRKEESHKVFRLNARGKIAIAVFSIVFVVLVAFAIYNGIALSSLSTEVALKNQAVASQTVVINDLTREYNDLTVDVSDGISMGYRQPVSSDYVEIVVSKRAAKNTTQIESNWFDRLCEFLSNLFG